MRSLRLVQRIAQSKIREATNAYLRDLVTAPVQQSEASARTLLGELAGHPGPHVREPEVQIHSLLTTDTCSQPSASGQSGYRPA